MAKLHQLLAKVKTVKKTYMSFLSESNKALMRKENFTGFSRTYTTLIEEGHEYSPEKKKVISSVQTEIDKVRNKMQDTFQLILDIDHSNRNAVADIVIDDKVIAEAVPIVTLITLEKSLLKDLNTYIGNIPVLDPSKDWSVNNNTGFFESEPEFTTKTKKTKKVIRLADATEQHAEQVELETVDVIEGKWRRVSQSSEYQLNQKTDMKERLEKLLCAVREAAVRANDIKAEKHSGAESVVDYIFGS